MSEIGLEDAYAEGFKDGIKAMKELQDSVNCKAFEEALKRVSEIIDRKGEC